MTKLQSYWQPTLLSLTSLSALDRSPPCLATNSSPLHLFPDPVGLSLGSAPACPVQLHLLHSRPSQLPDTHSSLRWPPASSLCSPTPTTVSCVSSDFSVIILATCYYSEHLYPIWLSNHLNHLFWWLFWGWWEELFNELKYGENSSEISNELNSVKITTSGINATSVPIPICFSEDCYS